MPKQHDEKVAMLHFPPHGAVLTILTHEHITQVLKASHYRDMRSWTGVSNFRGKEIRARTESTTVRTSHFILCCVLKRSCEQLGSPTSAVSDSCLVLFLCGCSQRVSLVVFCYSSARCLGVRIAVLWFRAGATLLLRGSRVRAFLEYMAIDPLKFVRVPDPFGDRGSMPLMATWS